MQLRKENFIQLWCSLVALEEMLRLLDLVYALFLRSAEDLPVSVLGFSPSNVPETYIVFLSVCALFPCCSPLHWQNNALSDFETAGTT